MPALRSPSERNRSRQAALQTRCRRRNRFVVLSNAGRALVAHRAPELSSVLKRLAYGLPAPLIEGGPAAGGLSPWGWPWARWPGAWHKPRTSDPDPETIHAAAKQAPLGWRRKRCRARNPRAPGAARAKISKPQGANCLQRSAQQCSASADRCQRSGCRAVELDRHEHLLPG